MSTEHIITLALTEQDIFAFNDFVRRAHFNTFLDCLRSRDVEIAIEMQDALKAVHAAINEALAKGGHV
ncbi:MAG: hypothetical protein E6Q84_02215 [Thiothrix sp.]|nr:MAG: hypothetical protein E6Q84_02215 [Thiothrix sp.]